MIILEPRRQIKNISFSRAVLKQNKTKNVFGPCRSIDFDHHKDTVSWAQAESQLRGPQAAAMIFLSELLLGSTSGLGGIRKRVSQIEAHRKPLSSEKIPGDMCDRKRSQGER